MADARAAPAAGCFTGVALYGVAMLVFGVSTSLWLSMV
jgi:hypothetical protein